MIVDDVTLIAGAMEAERLALRQTLRSQLAKGEVRGPEVIAQASYTEAPNRKVKQAIHEAPAKDDTSDIDEAAPPRELEKDDLDPFAEELVPLQ